MSDQGSNIALTNFETLSNSLQELFKGLNEIFPTVPRAISGT